MKPFTASNPIPTDPYIGDDDGDVERFVAYAKAIRAALRDPAAPWPLLAVRRDTFRHQTMDYQATLLFDRAKREGLISLAEGRPSQQDWIRFEEELTQISADLSLNKTAAALLERMVLVDEQIEWDGSMSDDDIATIVGDAHIVSASSSAGTCSPCGRPSGKFNDDIVELTAEGWTTIAIAKEVGLTVNAVRYQQKNLIPWHALCIPANGLPEAAHTVSV